MKKFVIAAIFLPVLVFGQNFMFHSDTLDFHGQPGGAFDPSVGIRNTSSQPLFLSIIRTQNDLPDSMWFSNICTGELCFDSELDTLNYSGVFGALQPDSIIDFHLQVVTNPNASGVATVTIKVENQANPSDTAALTFTFSTMPTDVKERTLPVTGNYQLFQNYPNPFNPETTIPFEIGGFQPVASKLTIYNIIGQQVVVPLNKVLSPGVYEVAWDGRDNSGRPVSSGMYFYELAAGNFRMLGKMILLK